MLEIELQIDRFGQAIKKHFDGGAVGRSLTLRDLDVGAKDAALSRIIGTLLRPVDLLALGVDRNSDAPSSLVEPLCVTATGLNERFKL